MSVLPPPPPPPLPASEAGAPPPPSSTHSTVYVGHLSARTERRDVEELFEKYGRLVSVELKHGGFAFVEYEVSLHSTCDSRKISGLGETLAILKLFPSLRILVTPKTLSTS
ncbi:hypothetical protein B0O80DRAFT_161497 [Mortierella sp. GBAus27b]|nr:hypothetical protein B0O80DRAFT_161497 [Mortierella sp. GBAus27b]